MTDDANESVQRRERSLIDFPYNDLEDAADLARAVWRAGGETADSDQVAAVMNQTVTSGAFRLKVSAARTFSVIETERGGLFRLTEIGRRIVDPDQEREAFADAFLAVPLYARIYEKFKGRLLPPPQGLESEMAALGVSRKQTDKARQAFDRSARQAGFYDAGEGRLVRPISSRPEVQTPLTPHLAEGTRAVSSAAPASPPEGLNLFVAGLIKKLPEDGTEWPMSERAKWLRAAASAFDLIYEGDGEISITYQ